VGAWSVCLQMELVIVILGEQDPTHSRLGWQVIYHSIKWHHLA
jgi:hypothetical protein